jgi:hypothetical protein
MNRTRLGFLAACTVAIFVEVASPTAAATQQGTIYWVDGISKLGTVNLDGSNFQVPFSNLTNPVAVDVSPNGFLYWIEGGAVPNYKIRRSNLDGSNPTTFALPATNEVMTGLSVNQNTSTVYWIGNRFINTVQGTVAEVRSQSEFSVVNSIYYPINGFSPLPRTVAYDDVGNRAFVSPGLYSGIEAVTPPNVMAPYYPVGGTRGLDYGAPGGQPTVFFDNGTYVGTFDPTVAFPTPTVTNLPVPAAADPIYGIDYDDSFSGRLVWGTVGNSQSQLFTALPDGSDYQVVYTGPEKFVDVAFRVIVPPVPEPSTALLVAISAAAVVARRKFRGRR